MKIIGNGVIEVAQESVSDKMLFRAGLENPDYIPTIMRAYPTQSPLNYILDLKGMKTSGLSLDKNTKRFRPVSSNHIKFRVDEDEIVMRHFKANQKGLVFECPDYPTKPGYNQSLIYAYSDSNWDGFQEVIELRDNTTYLFNLVDPEEVSDGVWKHTYKIVTNDKKDFVDPDLFEEGAEYITRYNMHEQDFSERGVEKYSFKTWGDAYLTLQRFKYSISGTAKAKMKARKTVKGNWVRNGSQFMFLTELEQKMMRRATEQLNAQYLYGKSTVSAESGKVILRNMKGRDVMAGSGILFSNGGPVMIPFDGWTKAFLDWLMQEIDQYLNPDAEGVQEVVMLMAPKSYTSFQTLMRSMGITQNSNITGEGASKGINDTYRFYELGGIRLIAYKEPSMRNRPRLQSLDGGYSNDLDTILVPLGKTMSGNNGVELVQLRPASQGTVAGIDEGGNIASSVDGSSTHILFQNGIINMNRIFMLRKSTFIS